MLNGYFWTLITTLKPKNLVHIILDNSIHESTGGQPTASKEIQLKQTIKSMNYKVFQTESENELKKIIINSKKIQGPIVIIVKSSLNFSFSTFFITSFELSDNCCFMSLL